MKTHDIVAVTGTYTNAQGEEKKRYQNVGAVIDKGNGPFIVLEKWFNPAGLESPILSMYAPKALQEKQQTEAQPQPSGDDFADEIPF